MVGLGAQGVEADVCVFQKNYSQDSQLNFTLT